VGGSFSLFVNWAAHRIPIDDWSRTGDSGKTFAPEDVIRENARIEAVRTRRLQHVVAKQAALGPDAFAGQLALLEPEMPYNCEHVVAVVATRAEPIRGDLHHLQLRITLQQLPRHYPVLRLRGGCAEEIPDTGTYVGEMVRIPACCLRKCPSCAACSHQPTDGKPSTGHPPTNDETRTGRRNTPRKA